MHLPIFFLILFWFHFIIFTNKIKMCMIINCEYLHCSLESTIHTCKNVLKGDFCSQWLIQIIHHSLVIVYTDSSEFPWWNHQMQFLSIFVFLQLFRLDYLIFFSFLCLAHVLRNSMPLFLSMLLDKASYSCCYPVQSVSQRRLWELAHGGEQCCSVFSATLGTSGKDHSCQGSRDSTGDSAVHCHISLPQLILKYLASNCSQCNDNGKGIHCTLPVRALFLLEQNLTYLRENSAC